MLLDISGYSRMENNIIILHINIGKNYMASIIEAYRYVHIGKLLSNDAIIAEADVLPYRHGSSRLWGIHYIIRKESIS